MRFPPAGAGFVDAEEFEQVCFDSSAVLDRYAAAGGRVREVAIEGAGHSVQLERPKEFLTALVETLDGA
ncbi:hypothetical protein OG871_07125 [Kitasatospora sp. NBC_00374]|uniref:alpha/beta fold hydrolase n=1 Tax=Kitasatospora sp. NBC_00374 TaxID=2975964 RepID=UPI0030E04249